MKLTTKKTRLPFTEAELRGFNERIKGSARIARNKKKYYRPAEKKEGDK